MDVPTQRLRANVHRLTGLAACDVVPLAAIVSGGVGDAVVEICPDEHQRRLAAGLEAVTDLLLLDRLLSLPLCEPVNWNALPPLDQAVLRATPSGVVGRSAQQVQRLLTRVVNVRLVIVQSDRWRQGLRRASAFEQFAQRVVLLARAPTNLDSKLWEADALGVGVWVQDGGDLRQLVAPAPWRPGYIKAAGWRFSERAYRGWRRATATSRQELFDGLGDRQAQPAAAANGQLQL